MNSGNQRKKALPSSTVEVTRLPGIRPQAKIRLADLEMTPAITVDSETTILECLALMKRSHVNCLLVMSGESKLKGIFTESDLLKKLDLGRICDQLSYPVRSVMSFPVLSVSTETIKNAPLIMALRKIRHLPVYSSNSAGVPEVSGVLTPEGLLRSLLCTEVDPALRSSELMKLASGLAVIAEDSAFLQSLRSYFQDLVGVQPVQLSRRELLSHSATALSLSAVDRVLIDTASIGGKRLSCLIRSLLQANHLKRVVLVASGSSGSPETHQALLKLNGHGPVRVVTRPVSMEDLIIALSSAESHLQKPEKQRRAAL